jgi:hypothetical protein
MLSSDEPACPHSDARGMKKGCLSDALSYTSVNERRSVNRCKHAM